MPLSQHIALVSLTRDIPIGQLLQVGAAVQKQVTRDFAPIWGANTTVDVFEDLSSVPNDYLHVVVFNEPVELAAQLEFAIGEQYAARLIREFQREALEGIHLNAFTRQPFALVSASDAWTVAISHEVLEMIADPYGNTLRAAAHPLDPAQRVKYLLEICDPCQGIWYHVNGVPVSDFYTPWYFEPVRIDGFRYSFTGELKYPLHILDGGYVSWLDPMDAGLYQLAAGESAPRLIASTMALRSTTVPLRTLVDTDAATPRALSWASLRPASTAAAPASANLAMREAADGAGLRTAQAFASVLAERR